MDYLKIAEKFSETVWKHKDVLKLEDIMLYGSVLNKNKIPNDVDLMLIHNNNLAFEKMENLMDKDSFKNNLEIYSLFSKILNKYGFKTEDLSKVPELKIAMEKSILNVHFLDRVFFYDDKYKNKKIQVLKDPNFYNNIFSSPFKLWDGSKFSDFINEKYTSLLFVDIRATK